MKRVCLALLLLLAGRADAASLAFRFLPGLETGNPAAAFLPWGCVAAQASCQAPEEATLLPPDWLPFDALTAREVACPALPTVVDPCIIVALITQPAPGEIVTYGLAVQAVGADGQVSRGSNMVSLQVSGPPTSTTTVPTTTSTSTTTTTLPLPAAPQLLETGIVP